MVQNVSNNYRQDISNELHNKTFVNITSPVHSTQVIVSPTTWGQLVRMGLTNLQVARRAQSSILRVVAVFDPTDAELPMKIEILEN